MERFRSTDIGKFINIGSDNKIIIHELAGSIKEVIGFSENIKFDPSKPDGTPRKLLDISPIVCCWQRI